MARATQGITLVIQLAAPELILASGSAARCALLKAAGLRFSVQPPVVNEEAVKHAMYGDGASAEVVALALAIAKADSIQASDAVVLGADQILVCHGEWYDKPGDVDSVMEHLLRLRGRTHTLVTAVCCRQHKTLLWQHVARSELTMREFSTSFLETYLAKEAESCISCVGGYRFEGLGIHLFDRVEGEHAAILGLPMLALLQFLRKFSILST